MELPNTLYIRGETMVQTQLRHSPFNILLSLVCHFDANLAALKSIFALPNDFICYKERKCLGLFDSVR